MEDIKTYNINLKQRFYKTEANLLETKFKFKYFRTNRTTQH